MKKIIINATPWQTRIAVTRDDLLQNIYFDAPANKTLERSFFKGTVAKVLPGIQTAFVDIGQPKAGFLHISEIDRELAIDRMTGGDVDEIETEGEQLPSLAPRELNISKILHEGEHILVQVSKEPINEKGAKLTTCFTLPGRFLVLMPNIPRIGISKKIENREERQRLRELVLGNLPEGMGAIIRTTSEGLGEKEILQDLQYLVGNWNTIQHNFAQAEPHTQLFEDIDLSLQMVRDHLDHDVEAVICDSKEIQSQIYKFVKSISPEHAFKIKLYTEKQPLFEHFNIEQQIEEALHDKVNLKSGGSIVIESTEAMTVVDVNTGRYIGSSNLEDTILKTNTEAAEEIVRQLRLRNIGGLIVIDFIDMATAANRQKLSKTFEKALKERDKFQSVVLKVSEFGLIQMTRKRSGKTLLRQMKDSCDHCHGTGTVKSVQTEAFLILRKLEETLEDQKSPKQIMATVHPAILEYITTTEYKSVLFLEKKYGCTIIFSEQASGDYSHYALSGE